MQMLVERKIKFIVNATAAVPNHFEDSILYPAHAHAHARQSAHPCSVPASQPVGHPTRQFVQGSHADADNKYSHAQQYSEHSE
jgi:hypothetical protein